MDNRGKTIFFRDHPEFTPNVTPYEMFDLGVFGGTYFRPINSGVINKYLKDQHLEFSWTKELPYEKLCNSKCHPSINYYGVKAGSSLNEWESKGWITAQDPYGWVQWYCRFFQGRRSVDDERQIDRWNKYTGPVSGRWKRNLINRLKEKGAKYNDPTVSPVIRQGLLQWAYMLVPEDLFTPPVPFFTVR